MNEQDIRWTKVQLVEALRVHQTGLADIHNYLDELAEKLRGSLTPDLSMFIDQVLGAIVATTVDVADVLDE
jgi:hypothetical protein